MVIIDIGARVTTSDRKKVASVDRVVINPETDEVTHLVLHRGMLLTRDIVVPITAVRAAQNNSVQLNLTAAELDSMPDFVDTEYVVPQHASATGPYIPGSVLWPSAYAYAPTVTREERHVPESAVDITEGTDVVCPDGKVGEVDKVVYSEETGEVIGLVLKRDVLGRRDGIIPLSWVEYANSQVVKLNRGKQEVEDRLRYEDIRG